MVTYLVLISWPPPWPVLILSSPLIPCLSSFGFYSSSSLSWPPDLLLVLSLFLLFPAPLVLPCLTPSSSFYFYSSSSLSWPPPCPVLILLSPHISCLTCSSSFCPGHVTSLFSSSHPPQSPFSFPCFLTFALLLLLLLLGKTKLT